MKPRSKIRRLGPFEIVKDLAAKGAQGKLYVGKTLEPCFDGLAEGSLVALKVMEVHDDDSERAFKRLKRRTDALVAASNPGVVRYYGCFDASDESSDRHVIAMELLKGQTLEECLEQNRLGLDADQVLRIIRICAEALVTVAEYGLVHRDIKPSNIFLCEDGGVKLIDFEIARQEGASRTTTESGAMRGTVDYMAPDFHPDFRPEKGFRGDECSDVFSLTVCLYEMLAGSRPYAVGGTMGEQSMMAYFQRWTKVAGADVSKSLKIESYRIHALAHVQKVIKKGLSPEREGRYRTYREFWEALQNVKVREIASPDARYALLRCVGKGGFGVVFRARRIGDGLVVAIKCLLRPEYAERFTREARALARFRDDRIVAFVEYFSIVRNADETHFIVMQFLNGMPGSSLRDRIATMNSREKGAEKIPFREIQAAFKRYAGGLKVLHDGGIIHRDIKPANLYMPTGAPERACVMDLGVVKTEETQTNGSLPGTLDYMPPEMALGQSRGTPAVDIYALGLCLHEALTGQPLFPRLKRGGDGLAEFYRRAKEASPPDLSRLDSMPAWQSLVRDMTAHEVSQRIADCAEVERRLDAIPAEELPEPIKTALDDDFDDDTVVVPRKKVVRKFGSEVGLRFGQNSKSVSGFQGSDEETEEIESLSGQEKKPDNLEAPAQPEKTEAQAKPKTPQAPAVVAGPVASPKSEASDDETRTAALAGETAAVAAVDLTKTAVAKDDTVATNATNATLATKAFSGKEDLLQTSATRAATETRPTAKVRKPAKPLIRIQMAEALAEQKKQETKDKSGNSDATAKPKKPDATEKQETKQPKSAQPALVVTRKKGVNPFAAIAVVLLFAVLAGGVFYMKKKVQDIDNQIVEIPPTKPVEPPITPPPPDPAPGPDEDEARRQAAESALAKERESISKAQEDVIAATTLEKMQALKAVLDAQQHPAKTGYADIDGELESLKGKFDEVKGKLAKGISDEQQRIAGEKAHRKDAESKLAKEQEAISKAQKDVGAATTLDKMQELMKALDAHRHPAKTGYKDIDGELESLKVKFDETTNKLAKAISDEQQRIAGEKAHRKDAESKLAKEQEAISKAQKDVGAATTLDKMQELMKALDAQQHPAKTGYADIDGELESLKGKFDEVKGKLAKGISDEQKRIAEEEARRKEADDMVVKEAEALATVSNDLRNISSKTAFDALRTKLANRLAPSRTQYADLNKKLDAIDAAYSEMKRDLDGRRATLTLANPLPERIRYSIDGKSHEVAANGRMDVELPVWTDSFSVKAEVIGAAADDYDVSSGSVSTDGATGRGPIPQPQYKGDPKLTIVNNNAIPVEVRMNGGTKRLASGESVTMSGKPRTYATIEYSFGDEYELVPGATASTTVQLGAAGTSKTAQAPSLRIKPRIAIIENPLAGFAKWTLPDGRTLSESSLEVPLGDKNKIVLEPLKPDYALWPEYDRVELDVSGVKRGAGAQRLSFKPAVNVANRVANIEKAGWNAFKEGKWYWMNKGPAYDASEAVRKAECSILQNRLQRAFPTDVTKTEHVADWINSARIMRQLLSNRYDGIRTIDAKTLLDYKEKFGLCNPWELKDKHGNRQELIECLQAIGAADGSSLSGK